MLAQLKQVLEEFIYKPKQIQDLWDSLLRSMPIGSILLKEFSSGDKSAEVNTHANKRIIESTKPGYHLMDGQQRTLSMLLGFQCSSKTQHKLWIDFSEPGKNGSEFQFRVSTTYQPFGYRPDGNRLSMHERKEAHAPWDVGDKTNEEIFQSAKPWKAGGNNQKLCF